MKIALPSKSRRHQGYTLIEVLVASSILMMAVSAACVLSLNMVTQEELNHRIARSLNYLENAGRICQIGISASAVQDFLPANTDVTQLNATTSNVTLTDVGTMQQVDFTMTFRTTPPNITLAGGDNTPYFTGGGSTGGSTRSETIRLFRTTINP